MEVERLPKITGHASCAGIVWGEITGRNDRDPDFSQTTTIQDSKVFSDAFSVDKVEIG